MADIDYGLLQQAVEKALKNSSKAGYSSGGGGRGGSGSSTSSGSGMLDSLSNGVNSLKNGISSATDVFDDVTNSAERQLDTFNKLSNSGNNFNNDLIGINVSAAQTRQNLDDFSDVISQNGKYMAGLGGSVSRGSQAFVKIAKDFYDSNATDELRQLGYSTKELNDVLAVQVGTQRYTTSMDEEGRRRSYESARALAKEMDAIAKLTGKSRQEQVEEANKRKIDGQVEAKFRLIGIQQGADAEKRAREGYQTAMAAAAARGQEQMAKEQFATGTVISEEAQMQMSLFGKSAIKTAEQMDHLAHGRLEAAEQASKEADAYNLQNQNNEALLTFATLGEAGGAAAKVMVKSVEDNATLTDSVKQVAAANGILLHTQEDYAKALQLAKDQVAMASMGFNEAGKKMSGATEALQNFDARIKDVESGLKTKAYEKTGEAISSAGQKASSMMSEQIGAGKNLGKETPEFAQPIISSFEKAMNAIHDISVGNVANLFINNESIPKRAKGTIGSTGDLYENPGLYIVGEGNEEESILTKSNMMNFAKSALSSGKEQAYNQFSQSISEYNKSNKARVPTIDTKSMSKEIHSTINITGGGTTNHQMKQNKDSLNAEFELDNVTKQFETDMQNVRDRIKSELGDNATFLNVQSAIKTDPIAKQLKEDYNQAEKVLSQRINAGKSFETFKQDFDKNSNEALQEINDFRKETINSIVDVNDSYGSHVDDLKNYKNEEIDFDKKFAEQQKELQSKLNSDILSKTSAANDVIGKSVEGMSEDAIKALLPAGSKMEEFYVDINGKLQSYNNDYVKSISAALDESNKTVETKLQDTTISYKTFNDELTSLIPTIPQNQLNNQKEESTKDFLDLNSDFLKTNNDFLQSTSGFLKNNQNAIKDSIPDNFKDLKNDKLDETLKGHFNLIETQFGNESSDKSKQEFEKNFTQIKEYLGEDEANKYKENFSKSSLSSISETSTEKSKVPTTSSAMESVESTQRQIDDKLEKLFGIENTNKPKQSENKQTKYNEEPSKPKQEIVKKEATLNDVVMSLEMLNKQMSQLLTQHEDIGRKQVKATRDNNGNLFKI